MAGNHVTPRPVHDFFMLALFVGAVGWAAVDGWRDIGREHSRESSLACGTYRATQQLVIDQLEGGEKPPRCRWLAGDMTPEEQTAEPLIAVGFDWSDTATRGWQSLATASQSMCPSWLYSSDVLRASAPWRCSIDPRVSWMLPYSKYVKVQHIGLLVGDPPSIVHSGVSCLAYHVESLGPRLSRFQPGSAGHAIKKFASPPALLHGRGPLLTSPRQRLAMRAPAAALPYRSLVSPEPENQLAWNDQLLANALPYFGKCVDRAFRQTLAVRPAALIAQLQALVDSPATVGGDQSQYAAWAREVLHVIELLTTSECADATSSDDALDRLMYLSDVAERLACETDDAGLATELRRARYAMCRRIAMWRAVAEVVSPPLNQLTLATANDVPGTRSAAVIDADTPVQVKELMQLVEKYETEPTKQNAKGVSYRLAQLATSPDERRRTLADTLYVHYQGSNARLAVTDDLVNRLLPASEPRAEAVRDRVLGTPVTGRAITHSQPLVVLLPDPSVWRLGLQLKGHARANTVAFERTVKVRTSGVTRFSANQQVVFDGSTFFLTQPTARASSSNRFVGATSQYDPLPLVGGLVRSQAAKTFASRRSLAQSEVAHKTARRVEREMDRTLRAATHRAQQKFQSQVVEPLATGGVTLEPVELKTTSARLVARVRIKHPDGLTAHTPRPRAPSDSLASMQLHETGLSSLAAGLELRGQRVTAQEFADRLSRIAPYLASSELSDDSKDVEIGFAERDPVAFQLQDGKLQVIWSIDELLVRGRINRNFKVHVYYVPTVDGLVAKFDHAAGPYLEGRLRNATRMRLQTIFGKVFREEGQLVFGQQMADDPRLAGLMLTQLVIDDGWLGVALGPQRPQRTAQLDRYAPLR